jgi:RNA polymerase sigma factor (sigma-70 family)
VNHQSVTIWLRQLADGDQEAARKLWERYGQQLVELSRRRFKSVFGPIGDEDDLVQSVFRALWVGAQNGRLDRVKDRDELWWLLLSVVRRKAMNRLTYKTRQKRAQVVVSLTGSSDDSEVFSPGDLLTDDSQPPADLIMILAEEQDRLLSKLRDDTLRDVAVSKFAGYTHQEVAAQLGVAPRTVIRKLALIRKLWSGELNS